MLNAGEMIKIDRQIEGVKDPSHDSFKQISAKWPMGKGEFAPEDDDWLCKGWQMTLTALNATINEVVKRQTSWEGREKRRMGAETRQAEGNDYEYLNEVPDLQ